MKRTDKEVPCCGNCKFFRYEDSEWWGFAMFTNSHRIADLNVWGFVKKKKEIMKREDLFCTDLQYIENWVNRIESMTGLKCCTVRNVLTKNSFTKKELMEAFEFEKNWFKGLAQSIMDIC